MFCWLTVLALCSAGVLRMVVLALCSADVFRMAVLAFCSAGVFRIAVLALCSAGCRCWPCVLLVDGAGLVFYWSVFRLAALAKRRDLESTDLWNLMPRDQSATVVPVFERLWAQEVRRCARYCGGLRFTLPPPPPLHYPSL